MATATFKQAAILELIDKTAKGAASVMRNYGKMDKAAKGFNKETSKGTGKAVKSFAEFESRTKAAKKKIADLRKELRSGAGDFNFLEKQIKQAKTN